MTFKVIQGHWKWHKSTGHMILLNSGCSNNVSVLCCSLAVLGPRVAHSMEVLSPFISVLCHSD